MYQWKTEMDAKMQRKRTKEEKKKTKIEYIGHQLLFCFLSVYKLQLYQFHFLKFTNWNLF